MEGIMPQYSIDLGKTSVSDRLMARLDQWNKIGGTQTIIRGAQPECISPAAPLFLQSQQQPHQFRGTLQQEQEYMSQLEQVLSSGGVKEMVNVQVYNPTFLILRQNGRLRRIIDCRKINLLIQPAHFKMDASEELRQILYDLDYGTILNIKDAFLHIHFSPNLQQFLEFQFKNKSYTQFSLPFCWRRSALLFSKTIAIAIRAIREKWKVKIQNYMDDITLIHQSKQQLKHINSGNRLLSLKSELAPIIYEMRNGIEEMLSISRMELLNLNIGGYNDLSKKKKSEIQNE
ncbi:MAG: hypothetical protein EZS28_014599 [Streblomastix strix]|uniref:Reverse transcriptase domain-containing protein n=1 Tax=Streblomastix strix TaxID=222440 RepID=A0A5J4W5H7_9EUKA|nr:MAG: hypothetical protein EZS28_014599 [Streblomastix strix]